MDSSSARSSIQRPASPTLPPKAVAVRKRSPIVSSLVPQIIVRELINSNDPLTSNNLLKRVKKDALVQYANSLGIITKAKAMKKSVLLKNIIDAIPTSPRSSSRSSSGSIISRSSSGRSRSRSGSTGRTADELIVEADELIIEADELIAEAEDIEAADPETQAEAGGPAADRAQEMIAEAEEMIAEAKRKKSIAENEEEEEEILIEEGERVVNDAEDVEEEILNIEKPIDEEEDAEENVKEESIDDMRNRLIAREIPPERLQYIEDLLEEIQQPEETISNIAVIQRKVFNCLGLVN